MAGGSKLSKRAKAAKDDEQFNSVLNELNSDNESLKTPRAHMYALYVSSIYCASLPAYLFITPIFFEASANKTSPKHVPIYYIFIAIVTAVMLVISYDRIAVSRRKKLAANRDPTSKAGAKGGAPKDGGVITECTSFSLIAVNVSYLLLFLLCAKSVLSDYIVPAVVNYGISSIASSAIIMSVSRMM